MFVLSENLAFCFLVTSVLRFAFFALLPTNYNYSFVL